MKSGFQQMLSAQQNLLTDIITTTLITKCQDGNKERR